MSDNEKDGRDLVMVGPQIPGRSDHVGLRRRPDGTVEAVAVAPIRDGQPISEDAELATHVGGPLYEVRGSASGHKGPARANSRQYTDNWDQVFGRKAPRDLN